MADAEYMARVAASLTSLSEYERAVLERCRRSGLVEGYRWHAKGRRPPLPHWEAASEPGRCRVCGLPIERGGKPTTLTWHPDCLKAFMLWTRPGHYIECLISRQHGLCAVTAKPIGPPAREWVGYAEADHEVPIFRVRREMAERPWFDLLPYWGLSNLRAITRGAHAAKSAREARDRAGTKTCKPTLLRSLER